MKILRTPRDPVRHEGPAARDDQDAGHFLQEDAPDELVAHIHALIANAKAAA